MIFWTTSSSCVFISFFISGVMNVYVIAVSTDLTARVISVLLMVGEFFLNAISFACSMIIAYQTLSNDSCIPFTIAMKSRESSMDMVDPMKEFIEVILRRSNCFCIHMCSMLSIIPGVGYFSERLIRITKME